MEYLAELMWCKHKTAVNESVYKFLRRHLTIAASCVSDVYACHFTSLPLRIRLDRPRPLRPLRIDQIFHLYMDLKLLEVVLQVLKLVFQVLKVIFEAGGGVAYSKSQFIDL